MFRSSATPPKAENVTPMRVDAAPPAVSRAPLADPAPLLLRPETRKRLSMKGWLAIGAAGVLVAQVVFPYPIKPFVIAGGIAASFSGQIMAESARQQLYIAEQEALARRIAEQEADRASWHGTCSLFNVIGAWTMASDCKNAVDQKYGPGIRRAQDSRY
jgi:hypothetical protein